MRKERALGGCVGALIGLVAASAQAGGTPTVYDNQNLHPMGSRAAGMGGAYTALACDEVALHYNPASLSCAEHSHLELVANAYMVQHLSVPRALGEGQDLTATTYHSIPSAVGAVYVLADGDPDTRVGRQAAGFLISIPASLALKGDPTSPDTRSFLATTVRDDVLAGDLGYAIQPLPTLALGLSLGGAVRTTTTATSILLAQERAGGGAEFVALGTDIESLALGLRGKLGARFTPTPSLSLGLAFVSPSLDVYGSYKQGVNLAFAGIDPATSAPAFDATPVRLTGRSAAAFPMKISAGVAHTHSRWTLSADVSLTLPRSVRVAYDVVPVRIQGVPDPTVNDITLDRGIAPNVALGGEVAVSRGVAVALGAFTDFSTVPERTIDEDRVNMFGLSAALSLLGAQTRGTFGLAFSYGSADSVVQSGKFTFESLAASGTTLSTISRWNLIGVIGSSYSFLPDDVAAEVMERRRRPNGAPPVDPPRAPAPSTPPSSQAPLASPPAAAP